MKIKVCLAMFSISICVSQVQATLVEWNLMNSVYSDLSEYWGVDPIWHVLGANFDKHVYFEFWFFDGLEAGSLNNSPQNFSIWVREMSYGDVIDAESMLGEGLTYFYHSEKGRSGVDSDYGVYPYPNVFLAMCTEVGGLEPYYAYGWVELSGTDVVASAWDADGGPMIVGGGSALTPEPSSALLLLVGGALLALRRRAVA